MKKLSAPPAAITGPAGEADKIPGLDRAVDEGDVVMLGAHQARILNVGGHTLGHIAYHMGGHAFVGDSLFALGCGRVLKAQWRKCGTACKNSMRCPMARKYTVRMNIPPPMRPLP